MWELLLDCLWVVWSFFKLAFIGVYSLFQDLYQEHKKPLSLPPQHGRVAIVTGGSSGIGFHVTRTLCELGMHVIIVDFTGCTSLTDKEAASSNKKNIEASIKSIKKQIPDAVLEGFEVDLGSMKSVHKFAHQFKSRRLPLHILINNAGVMHLPYKKTTDGIEKQIAVNFMGHFLLTILLLPVLNVSGTNQLFARIVNISSSTHRVGNIDLTTFTSKGARPSRYSPYAAYAQSKLAIIMGTYELARRLKAAKCFRVTVNCLHPGIVDSNLHSKAVFPGPLLRRIIGRFYKTPSQGADTVLYVALSPDLEKQSGGYYENCQTAVSSKKSQSFQVQQAIWHTTCSVLSIDPHDLPSSRSHELMSNTGLAFSWHEDYMNSPYQTSASSPDKKTAGIPLDKAVSTFGRGEEKKNPSDSCVIDFDKDGEPSPHDRLRSSLETTEPAKRKDLLLVPQKKSDLNANLWSEKKGAHFVRNSSDSCTSEPVLVHKSAKENINNTDIFLSLYTSKQDQKLDPEQAGSFLCHQFMSTPTIQNSSLDKAGTGKLRAVMCGNDIIYISEDDEANSRPSSAPPSGTSSAGASGSYLSMEEGELNPSGLPDDILHLKSARSGSTGYLPCIHLDESMLESMDCESDPINETSEFAFVNEINPKVLSSRSEILENSSLNAQTAEMSPATSRTSLKSAPVTPYVSPVISMEERQFDTPNEEASDEITNDSMQDISLDSKEYDDWKNQQLKSNSSGPRDSSDEEFDDSLLSSDLGPNQKPRRSASPSISDDEEEDFRQERGRTMVRRCSRTKIPANENSSKLDEDNDEGDDVNISLPYPGMTNVSITPDHSENTCSSNNSPEKITPYQDNVILDFVSGVITEAIKLEERPKSLTTDVENPPSDENFLGVGASISEEAASAPYDSVDEGIRMFMKEGNEKFQDTKNFIPPSNTSSQEQKSNAFAQKGWDLLPHNASESELKAFTEHTILYNEMIRSGRVTPVKIQLDTVREESVLESDIIPNNNSPETRPTVPPKTLPKPKSSARQKVQNSEHNPQSSTCSQMQSPKVKILTQDFEEKMLDSKKSPPECPQNSSKLNSSNFDATLINSVNPPLQETSPGLEGGSSNEAKAEEPEKRESFSSDESEGIDISQIFFSPDISPAKHENPEDMRFMVRLPPENYKKASIIELDDNEKSDADDMLQGVPLLEEYDNNDDDDQFQGLFSPEEEEYIFQFKPKMDETSSKFKEESIDTSTDNLDSKDNSTKAETFSEAPPVAKKPVRPAQDTFTPKKPPPIAKKPVRPQQDPPPVAKKPVRPGPSPVIPEKTTTDPKTTMSPSESMAENNAVSTVKDTETPGKSTVTPEQLSDEKDPAGPVQGLPSVGKPMQEPVSPETSVKNLNPVSQVKSAIKESVNTVKESVSPVRYTASPVRHTASPVKESVSPVRYTASPVRHTASPVKESVSPVRHTASPVKESVSPVRHTASPVKESVSPVRHTASPVRHTASPVKESVSPVRHTASPVRHTASPVKESVSPVRHTASPVKKSLSPVRHTASPVKGSVSPVRHTASPVKKSLSPVRHTASPVKESVSPVRHTASPVKASVSPVRHTASPVKESVSPVRHTASPVKESVSPVRHTASPVKESVSPVRHTASPVKESLSPVRHTASPVRHTASPVKESLSPVRHTASPVKESVSPVRHTASPVKESVSPVRHTASPVRHTASPVKESLSPVRHTASPVKESVSPVRHTASPVKESVSPVRHTASPVKESLSPVRHTASPVKKYVSPKKSTDEKEILASSVKEPVTSVGRAVSPVKEAVSPVEQVASNVKEPDSPVGQATSTVKEQDSPVGKSANPVKEPDSLVRQTASPVKEPVSPVGQGTSPVKEPVSPVGQATSPVKEPDSPVGQATTPVKGPDSPVGQATTPVKGPDSPVGQATSPVKKPNSPVGQATSPLKEPDSLVGHAASLVKEQDVPVGQAASPVKKKDSPVGKASPENKHASSLMQPVGPVMQQVSPVKQAANPVRQTASSVKQQVIPLIQVASPVKQQVSPVRQVASPVKAPLNPAKINNVSVEHGSVSSVKSTAASVSPKKATEQPEKESECPKMCPGSSAEEPKEEFALHSSSDQRPTSTDQRPTSTDQRPTSTDQHPTSTDQHPTSTDQHPTSTDQHPTSTDQHPTSTDQHPTSTDQHPTSTDQHPTSTDSAEKDIRQESPCGMTLKDQACPQSPAHNDLEPSGQDEKRQSVDLTDQTDVSEASNLSLYTMAESNVDSEDWFDSQPHSSEFDSLQEDSDYAQIMTTYNEDDETVSNATLHSEPLSLSQSETKCENGEVNPKDSHSNC